MKAGTYHKIIYFYLLKIIFVEMEGGIGVTPLMSVFGELTARMTDPNMVITNI